VDDFGSSADQRGQIVASGDTPEPPAMSPGGHLITTAAACAASMAYTGSLELTAVIAAGGFLIDLDHAVDYVLFERQRDLRPGAFMRYYLDGRIRHAVLVLHSYELFGLLGLLAWWTDALPLWGYLLGALMHLGLDVSFNGKYSPYSIAAFYSFSYRMAHGFRAEELLGRTTELRVPGQFWTAFFTGAVRVRAEHPDADTRTADRVAASVRVGSSAEPAV
jgi:hypothetical protein